MAKRGFKTVHILSKPHTHTHTHNIVTWHWMEHSLFEEWVQNYWLSTYSPYSTLRQVVDSIISRIYVLNIICDTKGILTSNVGPSNTSYSILFIVTNIGTLSHFNLINTLCCVGSLILNLKEQSLVIRDREEVWNLKEKKPYNYFGK